MAKLSNWVLYALVDPRNKHVYRYLGITNNPDFRLWKHVDESRKFNTSHKHAWIRSLLKVGLEPDMIVLERVSTQKEVKELEKSAIKHYRDRGHDLTNSTAGGDGGSIEVSSVVMRKNWSRPEFRQTMSNMAKRQWTDPVLRAQKISAIKVGIKRGKKPTRNLTEQQRKALSERVKKQWENPVLRERLRSSVSKSWDGAEERRARQSETFRKANTGRKLTPEHARKLRESRMRGDRNGEATSK